jgi:hypothetical protein
MKNKKPIKIGSLVKYHRPSNPFRIGWCGVVIKNDEITLEKALVCWSNGQRRWVDKDRLKVVAEP